MVEFPIYVAILCQRPAAAGLLDRVSSARRLKAHGFQAAYGELKGTGTEVVVAVADEGAEALGAMAAAIRRVHAPELLIGAGFSQSVCQEFRVGQVAMADRVLTAEGQPFRFKTVPIDPAWIVGTFVDAQQHHSESRVVAQNSWCGLMAKACAEVAIPAAMVTVASRDATQPIDAEVSAVRRQKSVAGKAGALLRAVWKRPGSAIDLASDKAATWEHQETLADAVTKIVQIAERETLE